MKAGIAPKLVVEQVKNTAAWLWSETSAAAVVDALGATAEDRLEYLRLLLAAHFSTVATFVPTDVDSRIRHHAWMELETAEALAKACDVVDEVASWDARLVSARTLDVSAPPTRRWARSRGTTENGSASAPAPSGAR